MLPDKLELLEQITTVINKNHRTDRNSHRECMVGGELVEINKELTEKHSFSFTRHSDAFKQLEHRIEILEDQNDRLLYFIHFLYKNFPHLVKDSLPENPYEEMSATRAEKPCEPERDPKEYTPALTPREVEILHLLVKGFCAKEIAKELFICETTVITHKKNLKEKFNARNTVELISKAFHIVIETGESPF
jgi:DNA-binding CsgD family transcriptional regulator